MAVKESKSARKARKKAWKALESKAELELGPGPEGANGVSKGAFKGVAKGKSVKVKSVPDVPAAERRDPPWPAVLLVCRKCGKRDEGKPGGLGAGEVRKAFKEAFGTGKRSPRVLATGCQSVCPKGVYVSFVGAGSLQGAVVRDLEQVPGLARRFSEAQPAERQKGASEQAAEVVPARVPSRTQESTSGPEAGPVTAPKPVTSIPLVPSARPSLEDGRKST